MRRSVGHPAARDRPRVRTVRPMASRSVGWGRWSCQGRGDRRSAGSHQPAAEAPPTRLLGEVRARLWRRRKADGCPQPLCLQWFLSMNPGRLAHMFEYLNCHGIVAAALIAPPGPDVITALAQV